MSKQLSEDEWKKKLTAEQYHVLREKGTGDFVCAACGALLFRSDSKYDSDIPGLMGWPSFADVAGSDAVELADDDSLGMRRTEVICKNCGSHLGHLFDDESSPTGQHYCINSASLNFNEKGAS